MVAVRYKDWGLLRQTALTEVNLAESRAKEGELPGVNP